MKDRWKSFLSAFFWTCVQAAAVLLLLFIGLWLFAGFLIYGGIK